MGFNDEYGVGVGIKYYEKRKILIISSAILVSVIIVLLFILALFGYTSDCSRLNNTAWATGTQSFNGTNYDVNYGLRGYCVVDISSFQSNPKQVVPINSFQSWSDCDSSVCSSCHQSGYAVYVLIIESSAMLVVAILLSFFRMNLCNLKDHRYIRYIILILVLLMWVFVISAFGNWNTQCYRRLDDHNGEYNLNYSVGYNVIIVTFLLAIIVFVLHTLIPKVPASVSNKNLNIIPIRTNKFQKFNSSRSISSNSESGQTSNAPAAAGKIGVPGTLERSVSMRERAAVNNQTEMSSTRNVILDIAQKQQSQPTVTSNSATTAVDSTITTNANTNTNENSV